MLTTTLIYGILILLLIGLFIQVIGNLLAFIERKYTPDWLKDLKFTFGASKWPSWLFLLIGLFWILLFGLLTFGLCRFIVEMIQLTLPQTKSQNGAEPKVDLSLMLTKLGALTAVLAAVVALPFTVIRLKLTTEQTRHNENVLYNDKLHEANNDLHAQRQVSVFVKDDDGNETTKRETIWEDDIIRRNGAIDRLEALAIEDPSFAPRIARMLCVYLKEMTRLQPAQKHPVGTNSDVISNGTSVSTVKRSDMEVAARVLGRMHEKTGVTPEDLAIDLSGVNLGNMKLNNLNFESASLSHANFKNSNLAFSKFNWGSMQYANLDGTTLLYTNFNDAELENAKLNGATIKQTKFEHANLNCAEINFATIEDVNFSNTDLNLAEINWSNLSYSKFLKSSICDTEVIGSDLTHIDFRGAIILSTEWRWVSAKHIDIRGADFHTSEIHDTLIHAPKLDNNISFLKALQSRNALSQIDLIRTPNFEGLVKKNFGDSSASHHATPEKWPNTTLPPRDFHAEWELFKEDPKAYIPPQNRSKS